MDDFQELMELGKLTLHPTMQASGLMALDETAMLYGAYHTRRLNGRQVEASFEDRHDALRFRQHLDGAAILNTVDYQNGSVVVRWKT